MNTLLVEAGTLDDIHAKLCNGDTDEAIGDLAAVVESSPIQSASGVNAGELRKACADMVDWMDEVFRNDEKPWSNLAEIRQILANTGT